MSFKKSPNSQASDPASLITRMSIFLRSLNCCGGSADEYEEDERPSLQISGPTNFRREEVKLAGLTEDQQRYIREKAASDAKKMWSHLQPLASSPSTTFAERPVPSCTYEQFTTARPAPNPDAPPSADSMRTSVTPVLPPIQMDSRRGSMQARLDRVRAHSRKISGVLALGGQGHGGGGYEVVRQGEERGVENPYELRALADASGVKGRSSGDSSEMDAGVVLDGKKF